MSDVMCQVSGLEATMVGEECHMTVHIHSSLHGMLLVLYRLEHSHIDSPCSSRIGPPNDNCGERRQVMVEAVASVVASAVAPASAVALAVALVVASA